MPAANHPKLPAPAALPEDAAYWQAAQGGQLLLKRCTRCARVHFYPRDICPHCLSDATEWVPASGRGTVYSYSHVARAGDSYTLAYVRLEEGVTMMSNLVGCDPQTLHVGQPVQVVFCHSAQGQVVPMFTPTAA